MDESTDFADAAATAASEPCVYESGIEEDLLISQTFKSYAVGGGELNINLIHLREEEMKFSLKICFRICTDGAEAVEGEHF
ncbi:Hypothetical predicted protein [Octopus vulgaris]|uniref:Uncharacterized protein n=1 Tax=Octopus vulgaris TaxID=6645 RepID=A0AA36BGT3_OCTVU|nr:Hypothetical predicted protein [Octopus vulgaris]